MNDAGASKAALQTTQPTRVLVLSGGVGGAKLALGLARVLPPGTLTIIANTGDDFEHLGLHVSPDIDTLTYALADLQNEETGWGRREETWSFMTALKQLGGETWFKLGDCDLAIHVERTRRLRARELLSAITSHFVRSLGISSRILPMTDDRVRTHVITKDGVLDFQHYFVKARCSPHISGFVFEGVSGAQPCPEILAAIGSACLRTIVICPSNPFLSIDPILAIPGIRAALAACAAPVVCVSPIVGGRAVRLKPRRQR
jgi:LPPG:FO 2-phospho-L-lactate transferase